MKRIKQIIISLILLNALVLVGYSVLFAQIWQKNKNVGRIENEIKGQNDRDIKLQQIAKTLEETKEERETISKTFLSQSGAISFIEEIESLSSEVGVSTKIDQIEVDKNSEYNKEKIRTRISVSGSWRNIHTFLGLLENLPYNIDIYRVSLSEGLETEGGDSIEGWLMKVDFSTLKQK